MPADDPNVIGAYFRLEVLGWLSISEHIDADPKALQVYSRNTGVDIGPTASHNLARSFELFLGRDPEFVNTAKQLHQKWVIVEGDLAIVQGPTQLLFGSRSESVGQTLYSHPPPRYVINVRKLTAAPAGVPNAKMEPYIKMEVRGVLKTIGRNPSLNDLAEGKVGPGTIIRTNQCNVHLFLGDNDKWLERANELNDKSAVARGELVVVSLDPPDMHRQTKPFGLLVPLPIYLLSVADLQAAPADAKQPDQKK
ncbi:MAG: hypothetical protein SGI86_20465 [Deltaproteobacteria bacterium]|nr:hypothetical protein [Deltaproteobacteria bacterium]